MPKVHQNTFGGWAPPGPAGGAYASPDQISCPQWGPTSKGTEGGKGERGDGKEGGGNSPPQSQGV